MRKRLIAILLAAVMLFTYTACEKQYTVKFNADGGSAVEDVVGNKSKIIETSPETQKKGYTFSGWYDGEEKITFPYTLKADKTLKAGWDIIDYNIAFDSNGGLGSVPSITYTVEDDLFLDPPDESIWPAGMEFEAWYNAPSGGAVYFAVEKGSTGDKQFWARWIVADYEITYHSNGGTLTNEAKTYTKFDTSDIYLMPPVRATYDFDGWYDNPGFNGSAVTHISAGSTGDKEFWAKWKTASYNILYNVYGSVTESGNYTYSASSAFTLMMPTRNGFTFAGWYDNGLLNGNAITQIPAGTTGAKEYWAKWTPTTYSITYHTNGGSAVSNGTYTAETAVNLPSTTRENYAFGGWFDNAGLTGSAVSRISAGSFGNKEYWAKWTAESYTITYNANGGTAVPNGSYTIENAFTLPNPGTRNGYVFSGWYDNVGLNGTVVTQIPAGSTGNREFWAKWTAESYTITYNVNGGTAIPNGSYTIENAFTLPDPGARNGYVFSGWYDNAGLTGTPVTEIAAGSTGNKIFWAKWDETTNFIITYNLNGGSLPAGAPRDYEAGDDFNLPAPLARAGYNFAGWFDNVGLTGTAVTKINAADTGNKTFWAKWAVVSYTLTYNVNGGTAVANGNYNIETPTFTLPATTRTGYTFAGWYNNAGLTGTAVTQIAPGSTGNREFWAKWTAISYTITYNVNGGTPIANGNYTIESAAVTLPAASRGGYIFAGWFDNVGLTGTAVTQIPAGSTGAKTFWAKWNIEEYTITYNYSDLPDGTYTSESLPFTLPTPAPRTGFTFEGWYNNSSFTGSPVLTLPAGSEGNQEFWAKWKSTDNTVYTITYTIDWGGNFTGPTKNDYRPSEAPFNLPIPVRTNYEFAGWSTARGSTELFTVVTADFTGNLTLYDNWIGAQFTVTMNLNGGSLDGATGTASTTYRYSPPRPTGEFKAAENNTLLPTPVKAGFTFGGWYETAALTDTDPLKPGSGAIGTLMAGTAGNKTVWAKWLSDSPSLKNASFGAENTDLTNRTGSGWSGSALEEVMIYRDAAAQGGMYLGWLNDDGAWVDFNIISDRATTATLTVAVNMEMIAGQVALRNIELFYSTPENFNYKICVNGKYYTFRITVTGGDNPHSLPITNIVIENVELVAGHNVILLINGPNGHWNGDRQAGPGVDCIKFATTANLSWLTYFDYSHLVD